MYCCYCRYWVGLLRKRFSEDDTLICHWKVLLQKGAETELQDLNLISVKQICMVGGMNNCMVFVKPQPTAFWSLWTEEPRPHVDETLAEIHSQAGHHHKPSRVNGETANAHWVEERDVKAMKGLHHCGGLWLRRVAVKWTCPLDVMHKKRFALQLMEHGTKCRITKFREPLPFYRKREIQCLLCCGPTIRRFSIRLADCWPSLVWGGASCMLLLLRAQMTVPKRN